MFRLRIKVLVLLMMLPIAFAGAHASDVENNKALVHRFVAAANALDFLALDSLLAPDMVRHSQSTPDLKVTNRDQFKAFLEQDAATFDGARVDVDKMIAEGDRVALFGVYTGVHAGPIGPIEATGKPISIDISGMFRIQNDRIVELWVYWDNVALLTQLGHPPLAPPGNE